VECGAERVLRAEVVNDRCSNVGAVERNPRTPTEAEGQRTCSVLPEEIRRCSDTWQMPDGTNVTFFPDDAGITTYVASRRGVAVKP
jgi:hypothetical protein